MKLYPAIHLALTLGAYLGFSAIAEATSPADFKAAVEACAQQSGIQLTPGQRPSKDDLSQLEACLSKKGIKPPQGAPPGGANGTQAPSAISAQ